MPLNIAIFLFPLLVIVFPQTAMSWSTPEVEGVLHNYTNVPEEELKISVKVECAKSDGESCGSKTKIFNINSDGTFKLQSVKMVTLGFKKRKYKAKVTVGKNIEENEFESFRTRTVFYYGSFYGHPDKNKMSEELRDISLYSFNDELIRFRAESGTDTRILFKNMEVDLTYDFSISLDGVIQTRETLFLKNSSLLGGSQIKLPFRLIALKGNSGATPEIQYRLSVRTFSDSTLLLKADARKKYNGNFPSEFTDVVLNDSLMKIQDKKFTGSWVGKMVIHRRKDKTVTHLKLDVEIHVEIKGKILDGTVKENGNVSSLSGEILPEGAKFSFLVTDLGIPLDIEITEISSDMAIGYSKSHGYRVSVILKRL